MRGLFITFEGPEGGGKTTQLEALASCLREKGLEPLCLREPGSTALGERIRGLLLEEEGVMLTPRAQALLFCAARAQLVEERIKPALDAGQLVLCDRYVDSTIAYQGYGQGLPIPELEAISAFATCGLKPDLTICLDVPAAVGLQRKRGQGEGNRMESQALAFHERVREGFLALARAEPSRWLVLDATQAFDTVAEKIRAVVEAKLREAQNT
jgi:dTMP kinase